MLIKLENIREHKNIEITIPDRGLVMLKGPSGVGKTTILDSIVDALYGNEDDVVTWGEERAKIEIHLTHPKKLIITRTHRPETLTVEDLDTSEQYIGAVAASFINKTLGMHYEAFVSCSYIRQQMNGSLLTLKPAEQSRFIHELGFGSVNPESVKEKIKEVLLRYKTEYETLQKTTDTLIAELEIRKNKVNSLSSALVEPLLSKPINLMKDLYNENLTLTKERQMLFDGQRVLEQSLANPIYKKISQLSFMEAKTSEDVEANNQKINTIDEELLNYGDLEESIQKHREEIKNIDSKNKYLEIQGKIKDIESSYNSSEVVDFLKQSTQTLTDEIRSRDLEIRSLADNLSKMEKVHPCPECDALLRIVGNEIKKADLIVNTDETKQKINQLTSLNTEAKKQLSKMSIDLNSLMSLISLLPENTLLDLSTIDELREYAKATQDDLNDLIKKLDKKKSLENSKNHIKKQIEQDLKALNATKTEINSAISKGGFKGLEEIELELLKNKNDIHDITIRLSEMVADVEEYKKYIEELNSYTHKKDSLLVATQEKEAAEKNLKEIEDKVHISLRKLSAAERLKDLSDSAALSSIELVLEKINSNAISHLEKTFPDTGTLIKLKNSSTTKKGEERAKISVDVYHKGKVAKKLSSLSGGEKSRACLAFQLALSDLYSSPILMIDEGLSGLDDDTKLLCLEMIKELSKDKLLLVVEHGAPEHYFDEVINIG